MDPKDTVKVGMIFECGPNGPDQQVCEYLVNQLDPEIEFSSVTLDNKSNLQNECGSAAAALFEEGCDRVVIIWDLYPKWGKRGERPCRHEDREAIFQSLANAGVDSSHVYLICIEAELEAWLLADERALMLVLSRPTHPVNLKRIRNTERVRNPKARLTQIYRENLGFKYNDLTDAIRIARAIPDYGRIQRCRTFQRFALKTVNVTF